MPRISVVVPIYNVAAYLAPCLQSLARQTFSDIEVIMVDDGSTDESPAIAERFADRDGRFRLLRQANGGLSRARNTGLTAAEGEFVAFADSDDVVVDDAYERMVRALDESGSDFATGNVHRITQAGLSQARFLAATFARNRTQTHISRFSPLLADRTAWNKLWRRRFWDEHAGRFPEGVVHEDIPVVLPAHLNAARVDVLAAPVYLYRVRDDGDRSITQRRLEHRVLRDRLAAIDHVRAYFQEHGTRKLSRAYDLSVLADDLRRHLLRLDEADAAYRATFIEGARPILEALPKRFLRRLRAIDRLKWHFVMRGLEDELLEVLRFEKEERDKVTAVRRFGRFYGDYPFRNDRRLSIPASVFRLSDRDHELALAATIDAARVDRGRLLVSGHARIPGIDCRQRAQRTVALGLGPGRWQAIRLRTVAMRLPTVSRWSTQPDADERDNPWSGFEVGIDPTDLLGTRGWRKGRWKVFLYTRTHMVRRRRGVFELASPRLATSFDLAAAAGFSARATISSGGGLTIHVRRRWARVAAILAGSEGQADIAIELGTSLRADANLRLKRRTDAFELSFPLRPPGPSDGPLRRSSSISLDDLHRAPASLESLASGVARDEIWDLWVEDNESKLRVAVPETTAGAFLQGPFGTSVVLRTRDGNAAVAICAAPRVAHEDTETRLRRLAIFERITIPVSPRASRVAVPASVSDTSRRQPGLGPQPQRRMELAD